MRYFGVFAAFLVALVLGLYRSVRTLLAFLITLGTCVAVSVAYIVLTGGSLTIVSPMVPMSILVTATSTLVYLQSRFVERPARPVDEHQIFALRNKFVAVTASIFATAVGFGALVVSDIRPISEMGIWGRDRAHLHLGDRLHPLPALQKALRTPTGEERRSAGPASSGSRRCCRATCRWRWPLVLSAVALSALGAVALFGLPECSADADPHRSGRVPRPDSTLYRDIRRLAPMTPGLGVTHFWLRGPVGSVSDPAVLTALHRFQQASSRIPTSAPRSGRPRSSASCATSAARATAGRGSGGQEEIAATSRPPAGRADAAASCSATGWRRRRSR